MSNMKYNSCYRKHTTRLAQAPLADPSPMTRDGTHAMVEMFYALKELPTQVGVGGLARGGSLTPSNT